MGILDETELNWLLGCIASQNFEYLNIALYFLGGYRVHNKAKMYFTVRFFVITINISQDTGAQQTMI